MTDRKITAMHNEYGKAHGYKCVDCPWLSRVQGHTKAYYKCGKVEKWIFRQYEGGGYK